MDSILTSIKKLLGVQEEYTHFDDDIIMHINSVFLTLNQLGVGPEEGFKISGAYETWSDYISDNVKLEAVKSYVYLKTRLLFDPPMSSALIEVMNSQIKEFEFRFTIAAESD